MTYFIPGLIPLAVLAGCAAQAPAPEKQVQANLAKAVDCSTAQADIKTLNSEKPGPHRKLKTVLVQLFL